MTVERIALELNNISSYEKLTDDTLKSCADLLVGNHRNYFFQALDDLGGIPRLYVFWADEIVP
jgi:hypothetical protein